MARWRTALTEKGIIVKPGVSEATIIRALVHAGADALRERALVRGYEEFAEMWPEVHDADDARERAALRAAAAPVP